jgi:diguanylate cyclase (GGDEF)-like protein/PAS domain S-box-containing protein
MANKLENSKSLFECKLLRSEKKFLTMFQLSPVGMAIVDGETGEFLEVNDALLSSTGYTRHEFVNLSYWDITPKKYEEQELQQIKDLEKVGSFGPNQKEYIRKDGTRYPISISGVALTDADGKKIVLGIIEDISERKAYEKKLKRLALYDSLTYLPNRRLLSEKLEQSIAQCKREKKTLAVLMLDLDRFKPVNDSFGHVMGDNLLVEIAKRITAVVHRNTDTVARIGGDEFVIVLPFISQKQDAIQIAEKICNVLIKPFYIGTHKITISSSIGIAIFPEHGEDEKTLLTNADLAMYKVKNENRNSFKLFGYE